MGTENRPPEARLKESWDANAKAWAAAVRENRIESRRLGTDRAIVDTLLSRPAGRLLDVGCGEGWLARTLAPHGFAVVGIDGSPALIEAARRLGGGEFRVLDFDQLATDPGSVPGPFDTIVCNFSLLAEDIAPVLRALGHRLAPTGELIIQTVHPRTAAGTQPYRDGWREESFSQFGGDFVASMPWYFRTLGSWIRELRAAGLAVTDCIEPLHPAEGHPLSLVLVCRRESAAAPTV